MIDNYITIVIIKMMYNNNKLLNKPVKNTVSHNS
jgi:hypothetical protein